MLDNPDELASRDYLRIAFILLKHEPVLVNEIINAFGQLDKGSVVVDGTLGLGGHSKEFLEKGFNLIGIDRDINALNAAKEKLGQKNAAYVHGNFAELRKILDKLRVKAVDGILLDLGVSTYQLEDEERGFGFKGMLDMRMDQSQELTAEKIVNEYPEEKLSKLLFDYGEKVFARKIAGKIAYLRREKRITSAEQLMEIIKSCMPPKFRFSRTHHWATPTFRALRMEVNKDIENLEKFLEIFPSCLKKNGIVAIISFHSIEDRIVKHRFRDLAKQKIVEVITKKPVEAGEKEIEINPKAERAKLRIAKLL